MSSTTTHASAPTKNKHHPLLSEVVLHNVLTYLPLNSVLNTIATSIDAKSIALSSPTLILGTCLSPDCARLVRVLQRFTHVAHVRVENAELLKKGSDFSAFAKVVPHVVHLQLTKLRLNCKTGGPFVEAFGSRFSHLRELSLDGSMFPTVPVLDNMVNYLNGKTLTRLSLIGCRTLEDQHLNSLLSKCPLLQTLSLPDCTRLQNPNLIHGHLTSINFSKCTSIVSFPEIRLPKVESVVLPWCRQLNNTSVEKLVTSSHRLQHLDIGGCVAIKTLHLRNGRSLETIAFGMCESIHTLRVEQCSKLTELPVGLCVGLRSLVLLRCLKVQEIDVSLLSLISSVHIEHCPALVVVNITTTQDTPAKVTILPASMQHRTKVMDECARLGEGKTPGATGLGTGTQKREEE